MDIELELNGDPERFRAAESETLLDVLRANGYTGTKCGCDGGVAGASKVLVDGTVEMACGLPAEEADGAEVETIEGLGTQRDLHPIQQAFVDHFAVQCGFCTPGMIMQAKALLAENPDPTEAEVREALDDNYCRCTGYKKPVEAILDAAGRMRGEGPDAAVVADGGQTVPDPVTDTEQNGDHSNE